MDHDLDDDFSPDSSHPPAGIFFQPTASARSRQHPPPAESLKRKSQDENEEEVEEEDYEDEDEIVEPEGMDFLEMDVGYPWILLILNN